MQETFGPTGRLTLRLVDPRTGEVAHELRVDNIVTGSGRRSLVQAFRLPTDVPPPPQLAAIHIVAGSPPAGQPTPPAFGDDDLNFPRLEAPAVVDLPYEQELGGSTRIVTRVTATFEPTIAQESITLNEAGVRLTYDNGSTVLYNRVTFASVIKTPELRMDLSWEIVF